MNVVCSFLGAHVNRLISHFRFYQLPQWCMYLTLSIKSSNKEKAEKAEQALQLLESLKAWFDETSDEQYLSVLGIPLNVAGVKALSGVFVGLQTIGLYILTHYGLALSTVNQVIP